MTTRIFKTLGALAVLVITGAAPALCQTTPVVWTSAVGVSASGNNLTKTAATGWGNAGASSTQALNRDGYVEATVAELTTSRSFGLSNGDSNQNYTDIDFSWGVNNNVIRVVEGSSIVFGPIAVSTNDVLRVAVTAGVVRYYVNGALKYTSTATPTLPLLVDTALYDTGATLQNVRLFASPGPPIPVLSMSTPGRVGTALTFDGSGSWASGGSIVSYAWDLGDGTTGTGATLTHTYSSGGPYTATLTVTDNNGLTASATQVVRMSQPIAWRNVVGATASGSNLTKTAAYAWGNAGAVSTRVIASGDGYVEIVASETSSRMFGLSNGDTDQNYTDIDFGVILVSDSTLLVYEGGAARGTYGTYVTGDRIRVAVVGGVVKYSKNGTVFYTSTVTPTYPLLVDTALLDSGSTIQNAVIFAQPGPPGPPVAVIWAPTSGRAGTALTFDGSGSWDSDGAVVDYAWSFGDGTTASGATATHTYASGGRFTATLTVTDNSGLTGSATQVESIGSSVVWTSVVGATASGNSLTKTAASGWGNAGAVSTRAIASGDGYVEIVASETTTYRMFGLSNGDTNQSFTDIDFAMHLSTGNLNVYEGGVQRGGNFTTYVAGDSLRVAVVGGVVKYSKNGIVFYTSTVTPTYPLLVDTALFDTGSTIQNAVIFAQPGPAGPPAAAIFAPTSGRVGTALAFDGTGSWDPDGSVVSYAWDFGDGSTATGVTVTHTYLSGGTYTVTLTVTDNSGLTGSATQMVAMVQPVVWRNVVGVTASGNNLTMTAATGWGNAGAVSTRAIASGDGYVEIVASETTTNRMFGLSNGDANQSYTDIDFAMYLTGTYLNVYEGGAQRGGNFTTYVPGDLLRVAVVGGQVRYSKNGAVFYTSTLTPICPLLLDTALLTTGSTIQNAVIFAQPGLPGPPTAVIWAPTSGRAGTAITFDGTGSWDPDGSVVSYAWNFGDGSTATGATVTHAYAYGGPYTVSLTVTDNSGLTGGAATQIESIGGPVAWTNVVGATASGSSLTKTAASGWGNAGAVSTRAIASGNGFVEIVASETTTNRMFGLSNGDANQSYTDIDFAIYLTGTYLNVYEGGAQRGGNFTTYVAGDLLRVAVVGGQVQYSKNGTVFYTSTLTPTYPLWLDTALLDAGSTIQNAVIYFAQLGPPGPPTAVISAPTAGRAGTALTFSALGSWDPDGSIASYAWNFGDGATGTGATVSHAYSSGGPFTVTLTVTDNSGLTGSATQVEKISESVFWKNLIGVTASGGNLTKTTNTVGWDAGASSVQFLRGDGYAEFTLPDPTKLRMFGFSHSDTGASFTGSYYGIYSQGDGSVSLWESGVNLGSRALCAAGDRFRIAVESGVVKYYKNGTLFYTSTVAPTFPLWVHASFYDYGAYIQDATIFAAPGLPGPPAAVISAPTSGAIGATLTFDCLGSWDPDGSVVSCAWDFGDGATAVGATVTHTYLSGGPYTVTLMVTDNSGLTGSATQVEKISQPVVWRNVVGVTASGNNLTKTAASAWGNAGAVSTRAIASGDGYVEIVASETTTYRMFGLSNGDTNQNFSDIDFAMHLSGSNLNVYEGGAQRGGDFTTYVAGDSLRVAVVGGVVKYSKNGTVFYTSTVAPTYPLLCDTALHTAGATIQNAVMYAAPGPPGAVISAPAFGTVGAALTFDGSGSWDSDGSVVAYAWNFGDGATAAGAVVTHTYSFGGPYTVTLTVTDNSGLTGSVTQSERIGQSFVWKNVVGVTASGNSLTMTAATGWGNAGASSVQALHGDGYVESTVAETTTSRSFGLSNGDSNQNYTDIDFSWGVNNNLIRVVERGTIVFGPIAVNTNDVLRVAVASGVVRYYINGVLQYTSTTTPTFPLGIDTALYDTGATIKNAVMYAQPGPAGPPVAVIAAPASANVGAELAFDCLGSWDPDGSVVSCTWDFGDGTTATGTIVTHTYASGGPFTVTLTVTDNSGLTGSTTQVEQVRQSVVWKNVVGATASGNNLTKTAAAVWGNAGASSVQVFHGDGYVEFSAQETATWRMAGLGNGDTNQNVSDIDFGIVLGGDGAYYIYESGTQRGSSYGNYSAGDVFRVAVTNGVVTYSRNSTVFFTSAATPTFPLGIDTALYDTGATIKNAVLYVQPGPPVAVIAGPTAGTLGNEVTFDCLRSWDPDGSVVSCTWDFGDGATATGTTVTHTYTSGGPFAVALTVTDDSGLTGRSQQVEEIGQSVVWKNVVGATASGNNLTKTAVTGWGNAGAASVQVLHGDGYVEFTAQETAAWRMAGLSNGDTNQNLNDIDFGIVLGGDGAYYIYEGGAPRGGSYGNYSAGDVFRVAVTNGVVTYSRNRTVFYTSAVAPTFPLGVDTALYDTSATIKNAVLYVQPFPAGPPAAVIAAPASAPVGSELTFDCLSSWDPDGSVVRCDWDFGDGTTATGTTVTHTYASGGPYTVTLTVTDNNGLTGSATQVEQFGQPIVWRNVIGATAPDGNLTKTAATGWGNAGAVSTRAIASGDGYVQVVASEATTTRMFGLSNGDTNQSYADIDFAIQLGSNGSVQVYEGGTKRGDFGAFTTGDLLRVAVVGGAVKYSNNGMVFYTSTVAPTYPLLCDTALLSTGATIQNAILFAAPGPPGAVISAPSYGTVGAALTFDGSGSWDSDGSVVSYAWDFGDGATATGATVTHAYSSVGSYTVTLTVTDDSGLTGSATQDVSIGEQVFWTNVVGVTVSGNSLTKTAASGWGNAGAVSTRVIASGDGYLQVVASETTTTRMFGLSNGDADQNYTDIDFAIRLGDDASVQVYEGGAKRGDFGTFATGDLLRVAVVGGAVKYSKNGTVLYTSAAAPTYPLLVDTALLTQGGTIQNAVLYAQPHLPGPPVAVILAPAPGNVGIALAFDGSGSWDPDGYVVSYAWDLGDGATATGAVVTHTYESGGTYTVTLTVTDNSGNPATASASVEVSASLVITDVRVTRLTATTALVAWDTNILSTGVVLFGGGTVTPDSGGPAKAFSATVTGLQAGVSSDVSVLANALGASTQSRDYTIPGTSGSAGAGGGRSAADGILPPGMEAGSPVGSYALSGFESVSLFSGNLSFALPLGTIAGRGAAQYTITLPISRTWNVKKEPYGVTGTPGSISYWYVPYPDTWSESIRVGQSTNYEPGYSPGVVALRRVAEVVGDRCYVVDPLGNPRSPGGQHEGKVARENTRVAFVSPDGTTHTLEGVYGGSYDFGASQACLTDDGYPDPLAHARRTRFESNDGSGIVFVPDQPIEDDYSALLATSYYSVDYVAPAGWLRFRDGTAYRVQDGRVRKIVDRNGNEVDLEYPAQQAAWDFSPSRITDSLGRVTTIAQSSSSDCHALDTITFGGYGGASRTLRVCRNDLADALYGDTQVATEAQLFPMVGAGASQSSVFNPQVVSSVRLPDGREYGFKYSKYGKLTKVTLPTGGVISYEYRPLEVWYVSDAEVHLPFVWHPVARRVASGPGAETLTTTYDYQIAPTSDPNYTYVTATETVAGVDSQSRHRLSGRPDQSGGGVDGPFWKDGRETTTAVTGAGAVLKTVENEWTPYSAGPQITRQTTTIDNASTSSQTHDYDTFGNLKETTDYGYDGSPIRRTCTQFVSDSAYTDSEHPNPGHPPHLISLPKREAVYVGNSGGDNCTDAGALAETTYEYDGLPLAGCTGIIHYDNGRDAYGPRGNVTAVNRWLSDPSRWLQSRSTYDIAGNLVWASDPRRYSTNITYGAEGGVYAFPTRVDRQVDGQTVHTTTATYDFNTGKPVSIFDANGVQTTYAYNDALERLTEAIAAANGGSARRKMTFTYNDAARTITTTSDIRGDQDGQSQAVYDVFGRTTATRRWSGYEWTHVDTEYDALGRVSRVWNPYYEGSSDPPTYPTTTQYDALGRVTAVTAPGNATTTTAYNGAATTVTDPEGKKRSTVTDALGRLASVTEDPGNLGFLTQYSYDVLGNLTQVQQGGQTRDFVYDSLSRLRSATNPESGKVSYEYDDAGNLMRRQDARGIVTMYDGYDGLNRVHQRTYSDGTDAVSFGYDAGTYGKGRMTSVQTSVSGSSYEYDAAGRVQNSSQTMPGGVAYAMGYTYSQGGLLNRLYYPGGRIAEYGHDAAGRTNQVSCLYPGAAGEFKVVEPGHLTYWPNGSIKYLRMWDWVEERYSLTPRNAVESLSFTNTAGSVFSLLALNYEYENNDNVKRQVMSGIAGATPFDQHYGYDPLNRLSNASDSGGWAQTYDYDRFGNRRVSSSSAGPISGLTPTAEIHINSDNNRIKSCNNGGTVGYDDSGNLITDCEGQIFAYDAENRLYMSQWPDQEPIYYRYNGDGHRIFKIGEAHTIAYLYDASGRLIVESDGIDGKDYVYLGSRLLARALGPPMPVTLPLPPANCPMRTPSPGESTSNNPTFTWENTGRPVTFWLRTPGHGAHSYNLPKPCLDKDGHPTKNCSITAKELTGATLVGDVHRWSLGEQQCGFWKFSVGHTIPRTDTCVQGDAAVYCPYVCAADVTCDTKCRHLHEGDPNGAQSICGWESYGCTQEYSCQQTCNGIGTCSKECPADGSANSLGRTADCKWDECCQTTSPTAFSCEERAGLGVFRCLATAGDCGDSYTSVGVTKDCARCCVSTKPACVGDGFRCVGLTDPRPDDYRPYPEASGAGSTCAGFGDFCYVRIPTDSCTWKKGGDYCSQTPCQLGYRDLGSTSDCPGSCCKVEIAQDLGYCASPQSGPRSCESLCFVGVPCDAPCQARQGQVVTASDCKSNSSGGYCLPWPSTCATCQSLGGACDPGDCPTGTSLLGNTPDCNFGNCCTRPQPPCVPTKCAAGACDKQSNGCGGLIDCGKCTSCTQTAGNQCATNGACPRGYSVIGPFEDCAQCCTPGPDCTHLAARNPDCLQTGTCLCLQSGSCSTAGNYTNLGATIDCNICCREQTCPEAVPDGPRQCLNGGGSSCPQGSVSIGGTSDCGTCCKYSSCAERGGICEPSGMCPIGYPVIGQTHDCNLCCQTPYCGDGQCNVVGETFISCPQDCWCGDGVCDSQENPSNCHQDCPF